MYKNLKKHRLLFSTLERLHWSSHQTTSLFVNILYMYVICADEATEVKPRVPFNFVTHCFFLTHKTLMLGKFLLFLLLF